MTDVLSTTTVALAASWSAAVCWREPVATAVPETVELEESETPPRAPRCESRTVTVADDEVSTVALVPVTERFAEESAEITRLPPCRVAPVTVTEALASSRPLPAWSLACSVEVAAAGVDDRAGGDGDVAGLEDQVALAVGPAELAGDGDGAAARVEHGLDRRCAEGQHGPAEQAADDQPAGDAVTGDQQLAAAGGDHDRARGLVDEGLDVLGGDLGAAAAEAEVGVVAGVRRVAVARGHDDRVVALAATDGEVEVVAAAGEVDGDVVVAGAADDRELVHAGEVEVDRGAVDRREGQGAGAVDVVQGAAQPLAVRDDEGGLATGDHPVRADDLRRGLDLAVAGAVRAGGVRPGALRPARGGAGRVVGVAGAVGARSGRSGGLVVGAGGGAGALAVGGVGGAGGGVVGRRLLLRGGERRARRRRTGSRRARASRSSARRQCGRGRARGRPRAGRR